VADYKAWKNKESVSFAPVEENYRVLVFSENSKKVKKHNSDPSRTYDMALNQFSGFSETEFEQIFLGSKPELATLPVSADVSNGQGRNLQVISAVATSIDWAAKGKITAIKNQGSCGSCWAFASTAVIEAMYKIKAKTYSLSEQELVDCSYVNSYNGCGGGWPSAAFDYVKLKKLSPTANYPYTATDKNCARVTPTPYTTYPITSYQYVSNNGNCANTKTFLSAQPIAVAVDASGWGSYSSGIFPCKTASINHGVLLVGYDSVGNWKIKNSWGTNWGEKGFIRISSGNGCAVCNYIWKVVV
jgi:cathepsin L